MHGWCLTKHLLFYAQRYKLNMTSSWLLQRANEGDLIYIIPRYLATSASAQVLDISEEVRIDIYRASTLHLGTFKKLLCLLLVFWPKRGRYNYLLDGQDFRVFMVSCLGHKNTDPVPPTC